MIETVAAKDIVMVDGVEGMVAESRKKIRRRGTKLMKSQIKEKKKLNYEIAPYKSRTRVATINMKRLVEDREGLRANL